MCEVEDLSLRSNWVNQLHWEEEVVVDAIGRLTIESRNDDHDHDDDNFWKEMSERDELKGVGMVVAGVWHGACVRAYIDYPPPSYF